MIPIQKEEQIRALLGAGLSGAEISKIVGVNRCVVTDVSKSLCLSQNVKGALRKKIQRMLLSGVPIGAIQEQTRIPSDTIRAIRRVYYLQRRRSDGSSKTTCPTCGAIMVPCEIEGENADETEGAVHDPAKMNRSNLAGIVSDVLQLRNLGLIKHPLFQSLANRAERALKVNDGKA